MWNQTFFTGGTGCVFDLGIKTQSQLQDQVNKGLCGCIWLASLFEESPSKFCIFFYFVKIFKCKIFAAFFSPHASGSSLVLTKGFHLFNFFFKFTLRYSIWGFWLISSVNNTSDNFVISVVDTTDHFTTGVVDMLIKAKWVISFFIDSSGKIVTNIVDIADKFDSSANGTNNKLVTDFDDANDKFATSVIK
jgi:hypothetical protein